MNAPKSNGFDLASGGGAPPTIHRGINASDVPFSAVKEFRFLAATYTSLLAIIRGILLSGKHYNVPLIPSFTDLIVLSTSST